MPIVGWRHVKSVLVRCLIAITTLAPTVLAHAPTTDSDPDFNPTVERATYPHDHPRVALDQAHHNFHTLSGRYRPFGDLLASDGYEVVPNTTEFSASSLSATRVLVIANALGGQGDNDRAQAAFSPSECDAVERWVREGGSLLLIADHAPMGSAAHDLAIRFGVDMGRGYVFDPGHSVGDPTILVFSDDNGLLGDHPLIRGRSESERIHRIVAFTGQSLSVPPGATALMKLGPSAFEIDSYEAGAKVLAGVGGIQSRPTTGRAQGVALVFGQGRVVVAGEAAMFSAQRLRSGKPGDPDFRFGMNAPGNDDKQFVLNTLHWLSGAMP
jgi:hypothetical protein